MSHSTEYFLFVSFYRQQKNEMTISIFFLCLTSELQKICRGNVEYTRVLQFFAIKSEKIPGKQLSIFLVFELQC